MVQVRQGWASMSPPLKQIGHVLAEGTSSTPRFRHGGSSLMRWQTDNLAVATDAAGNVKPDKAKSGDKIDGWAAAVTAMAACMGAEKSAVSAYDDGHGLVII
jgi:phage terminase large subunit-like protein